MPKTATIILLIVGVILITSAVVFSRSRQQSTADPTETATPTAVPTSTATTSPGGSVSATSTPTPAISSVTVTYTNTGFSPSRIEIQKGQTVIFKNESSQGMWVGSDPHPLHTDYSAFDSRKAVNSGQSYSFTFDRTGTWGYHNHSNSAHRGTVVVK